MSKSGPAMKLYNLQRAGKMQDREMRIKTGLIAHYYFFIWGGAHYKTKSGLIVHCVASLRTL